MYRVLIVEDDPMVALINEQYINRSKDFSSVGQCRNGKEALAFLEGSLRFKHPFRHSRVLRKEEYSALRLRL